MQLLPRLEILQMHAGKYLLRSESTGRPHCVALLVNADGKTCEVSDSDFTCIIVRDALEEALQAGVDSSTCVFFR